MKKLLGLFRKKNTWGNEILLPESGKKTIEYSGETGNEKLDKLVKGMLSCSSAQSVGLQRDKNEDSLFKICGSIDSGNQSLPFGIFVVADGMGGHQHGELASAAAVEKFIEVAVEEIYRPELQEGKIKPVEEIEGIAASAVRQANQNVHDQAPGGGTTLTAAIVHGDSISIAHIGDSRAYLYLPEGKLSLLTSDHSLVSKLVEIGHITEKQAVTHPQRNILLRALGNDNNPEVDVFSTNLPESATLVLCTDGLWGVIPEEKLVKILNETTFLPEACKKLVDTANDLGGPDNISVILIRHP